MQYRNLGNTGMKLSIIGSGCMGMSHAYGGRVDNESIATLEKAVEFGVNYHVGSPVPVIFNTDPGSL